MNMNYYEKCGIRFVNPNMNMSFDNFIVGNSNRMAFEAARAAADNESQSSLYAIWGASGVGKSHLGFSVLQEAEEKYSEKRCVFIQCEELIRAYVRIIHQNDRKIREFLANFGDCDFMVINDIDRFDGNASLCEVFAQTIRECMKSRKTKVFLTMNTQNAELFEKLRNTIDNVVVEEIQYPDTQVKKEYAMIQY